MKVLIDSVLEIGDIVLTTTPQKMSRKIRTYTNADISHAMLLVQPGSLVDSTTEGVQSRVTQREPFEEECAVHVLRLKGGLKQEQRERIVNYARSVIGTRYSVLEAGRTLRQPVGEGSKKQFCSRLVARAYNEAAIQLAKSVDFCSPADLLHSDLLEEIRDVTRTLPARERDALAEIPDTNILMRKATNTLLEGVRKISSTIESLNDLDQYLIEHRDVDHEFKKIIQDSGYLDVWRFECEKNPWQYDLERMIGTAMPNEQKEEYCTRTVRDSEVGLHRFNASLAVSAHYVRETSLETFGSYKELYTTLVRLHLTRTDVAKAWLRIAAPGALKEEPAFLQPHSTAWFEAVDTTSPEVATQIKALVSSAGRTDLCSICGSVPSMVFRILGRHRAPSEPDRLRFCDDCQSATSAQYLVWPVKE